MLGNLLSATLPGGTTTLSYIADGQNRRVGKLVNGALTQGFLYDSQLHVVAQVDGNNNIVSQFVYGSKANVPDYMVSGGVEYRIIADNLGSPRLVVNAQTGTIVQEMDYDEFGNVTNDTNPGFQPFGYAGGLYDRDLKLVRFGARDYDPDAGRWTAKDPDGFKARDSNLYAYVLNDPINFVDWGGKSVVVDDLILVGEGVTAADAAVFILGALITIYVAEKLYDYYSNAKNSAAKPKNCPTGTKPIDQVGLPRADIHGIKKGVGAGPADWVGIDPDGNVITGGPNGEAVNNGPYEDYVPGGGSSGSESGDKNTSSE